LHLDALANRTLRRQVDWRIQFEICADRRDRRRAEKIFKKEERARDGREAMTEYEAGARAAREKTARL
jgi:hypothetical protein